MSAAHLVLNGSKVFFTNSMAAGFGGHGMPRPSVALTFDSLTLKLVCESHLSWENLHFDLGTLGLWVLELFTMCATDGRRDKSNAYWPLPYGRGITIDQNQLQSAI